MLQVVTLPHLPYPSSFEQNIESFWVNRFCDDKGIHQAIALGVVNCLHNINTKHILGLIFDCVKKTQYTLYFFFPVPSPQSLRVIQESNRIAIDN
ncbi:hypothetical protein [uncultured Nostoc sp.]|uniref:hypothetical protein n=1 Tax=uncultured Nostoc sp. TaxID=340711 RepID=UPI0035CBFDF0